MNILGVDISLNHAGIVQLDSESAKIINYWYVTNNKAIAKKSKEYGIYFKQLKHEDKFVTGLYRYNFWYKLLNKTSYFMKTIRPFVGIEGYAYGKSQGAHQIGEIAGLAKHIFVAYGKLRIHDPLSIKMFAAGDGFADKKEMVYQVMKKWPETKEFERYQHLKNRTTVEDLCDAYAIARLVWLEAQLRKGKIFMSDLSEKEIQIFNRTTKTYPINILGREWISYDQIAEDK